MIINSNVKIDENKWKEFLYVFFKDNEDEVNLNLTIRENEIEIIAKNEVKEINFTLNKMIENQEEIMLKTSLLKLYDIYLPWGSLVGVRPSKLVRKLILKYSYDEIFEILSKIYLVSEEKILLLLEVVKNSIKFLDKDSIGIYIGLAFCPTKCTYCSFPAYLKKGKYLENYDKYFNCLIKEIEEIGKVCKEKKLKINSIYVGGGTPSYLNYIELEKLLESIKNSFDFSSLKEYTFEAGRIDTIDEQKLKILKKYLVSRISINPQSFKDETLKLVNRYHNLDKLNEVYKLSKEYDFDINMDFIIGLPKENTEDILNTLEKFKEYDPENVTFHYLALKKASYLTQTNYNLSDDIDFSLVSKKIYNLMKEKKYIPYYMYRQKNSSQDGENMGFCKEGKQDIYNIEMIEENKTIIAIGAGAISKIIEDEKIVRLVNPKDPLMWINEFDKRLEEKIKIIRGIDE